MQQQNEAGYDYDSWSRKICQYIECYQPLLDSYIIEFFTESHWDKLPNLWRETLNNITLKQFCLQLCNNEHQSDESPPPAAIILPLSLLAFSATADALSYCAYPTAGSAGNTTTNDDDDSASRTNCSQVLELKHLFRRHVKLKKQHEIKELTKVIQKVCHQSKCHHVIDLGCGQGHLARCLAYHCGYHVTAVEAVGCHLETAMQYDKLVVQLNDWYLHIIRDGPLLEVPLYRQVTADIERELKAKNEQFSSGSIRYIEQLIPPDILPDRLMSVLSVESSVLVGLHTCGDLSTTMLRLFSDSDNVIGLVSVGCCYMKLTTDKSADTCGYPISKALAGHYLSYEAKELACHSKEVYMKRLTGNSEHLKIHCWRAAVETILRKHGLKRPQIKIPASVSKLPFKDYANTILRSLGIVATQDEIDNMNQLIDIWWQRVVMYFLLRLKIAPCIEALLLIDRVLFLQEKGINCNLQPIFDPLLSPRNLVLTAVKRN